MGIEKGDDYLVIKNPVWPAIVAAVACGSIGVWGLLSSDPPVMRGLFVIAWPVGIALFFVTKPAVAYVRIDSKSRLLHIRRASLLRPFVKQIPASRVLYIEVERGWDYNGEEAFSVYM